MNEIKTKSPFLSSFSGKDPKLKAGSLSRFAMTRESSATGSFTINDYSDDFNGEMGAKREKQRGASAKKALGTFPRAFKIWYSGRDLNPHTLRQQDLNLSCLPIPPPEQKPSIQNRHSS
tara:strand:+ start:914 stop:1270 length:357 start_codon:yes stop_codon:yes gene_type:complete